ncbi:hypothetical protein L9F63_000503, partial [Diploptera punctata]
TKIPDAPRWSLLQEITTGQYRPKKHAPNSRLSICSNNELTFLTTWLRVAALDGRSGARAGA